MNTRRVVLDLLVEVENGAYANVAVPTRLRGTDLDDRDRAFVTDLVAGTLRRRGALDHLIAMVADRPIDDMDPNVRAALRLGTEQLVRGTPPHAAIDETVSAVGRHSGRGYVNAVLRRIAALGPDWPWPQGDDPASLAVRLSYPEAIVTRLIEDLGAADAVAVLEAGNVTPALTLRPNPQRATSRRAGAHALVDSLERSGATVAPGVLVEEALVVRGGGDPASMPAVLEGRATPQDEGSQAVARLVGALPGERILEVGAAPGGKATALAEMGAHVTALDVAQGRLRLVRHARDRLGLSESIAPVVADGRTLPFADATFDRVLVDAPCSGLGVLRRRPDARWRARLDGVAGLALLQRVLVAEAARVVKPGGTLVYSVCTLTRAETVDVDAWAAEHLHQLVALDPPEAPWPQDAWRRLGRGALLLPSERGTDGMYVLRLSVPDAPDARR